MAKDANALMNELGVTSTTDADTLINKLGSLEIINQTELLGVKSVSVTTLPTVVKNSEADLKSKMINIVTDEDKGSAYLINKRVVLIKKILSNINNRLTNAETNVNEIDVRTKNYIDLGHIEGLPDDLNNETLNNVIEDGIYTFTYSPESDMYNNKIRALMLVSSNDLLVMQQIHINIASNLTLMTRYIYLTNPSLNTIKTEVVVTDNNYSIIKEHKDFQKEIYAQYEISDLSQDTTIVNKGYVDNNFVKKTGDTFTGTMYMDVPVGETPHLIGKHSKIGIRAIDESGTMVGQFAISDSNKATYDGHYASIQARGNDNKLYSLRVSKKGAQFKDGSTDTTYQLATENYVNKKINDLFGEGKVDSTLDTIAEISKALKKNIDVATAVNNAIGNKADKTQTNITEKRVTRLEEKIIGTSGTAGVVVDDTLHLSNASVVDDTLYVKSLSVESGILLFDDVTFINGTLVIINPLALNEAKYDKGTLIIGG